jgi:outer membrane protein OmpA-like peptidoglycan-associated protein
MRLRPAFVTALLLLTPAVSAASTATEPEADETEALVAEAELSASDETSRSDSKEDKWIYRWAPVRHMVEVGVYGGVFLPSRRHELFDASLDLPDQGFRPFRRVAPDFGLRVAYFPLRVLGLELEGGAMPTQTDNDRRATVWAFRGHVIAQLPWWSITPFALAGIGALGVVSDREAVGNDVDISVNFGVGAKAYLNRWLALRLDARNILHSKQGVGTAGTRESVTVSWEILLGLSGTFGRKSAPPRKLADEGPKDSDGDGFLDDEDKCPHVPGVAPHGCPLQDRDGDGFPDDEDKCPDEPGIYPDGCPRPDRDGDGIPDDLDQCPDEPETWNGYMDTDGCPDELPQEIADFRGALEGIQFDVNKDTIKPGSRKILDQAAEILQKYPDIRVEIGGHTDATGSRDLNLDLSRRRARSVKRYLVGKGVDEKRVETRGYGPDKPVADNDTKDGRTKNRRIEFTIVQ